MSGSARDAGGQPRPAQAPSTSNRGGWLAVLRRWPTALAVGPWVVSLGGGDAEGLVWIYGHIFLIMPLLYLFVSAIERPRASWPTLLVITTGLIALRAQGVDAAWIVFVAVALIVTAWGAVRGRLRWSDPFCVQVLGMAGFGALALAGLNVDPDLGRYLVAAGVFLHGVWDLVHLKLGKVVVRSYAEWCGVIDILLAAELVFLL
jgi:hypothetical protein